MVFVQSGFTLPLPAGEAFALLVDPDAVAASLPGARPSAPGAAGGDLELDIGFAMVTLHGRIEAGDRDADGGSIAFHASGVEVESGAEVQVDGALRLNDVGGVTEVSVDLEVEGGLLLAAGGPTGVERTVRRLVDAFAGGLRERIENAVEEDLEAVGYGWMVAAGDDTEELPPGPAEPALPTPAAQAPAPTRRAPRHVPGRVEVVTRGPIPASGIPVGDGPAARIHALHRSRPWVIPAVLIGLITLALLLRRRSNED